MNKASPGNPDIGIRMLRITRMLLDGKVVTSADLISAFGVSYHTAKRDLNLVGMYLPVKIARAPSCGRRGGRFKSLSMSTEARTG